MGFFKDGFQIFGVCIGIIVLIIFLLFAASYIMDMDFNPVIDNNNTITINSVKITVPKSENYTLNDSTTLDYYNFNTDGNYKLDLDKIDNFNNKGTAHRYSDTVNHIEIMVINTTDVPYIGEYPDGEVVGSIELDGRYFQQKKTLDGKVVLVWVYDDGGKSLAYKIINSAVLE